MKVKNINNQINSNVKFSGTYKTEDILRLATGFPYKNKNSYETIREMTGIDIYSDKFDKSLPELCMRGVAIMTLEELCLENVYKTRQDLQDVVSTFKYGKVVDKKEACQWFKDKINQLGETMQIPEFVVDRTKAEQIYKSLCDIINELHIF